MTWSKMSDVPNPIFDANGDPYSGAVLKAYLPGTTTTTSIAIDSSGSSPQTTITANANGAWEVSGNEVVPHIDRKHKWAIFANAAHATANTPAYMGFFDNIEAIATGDVPSYDSIADAYAADLTNFNQIKTDSYLGGWASTVAGPKGGATYYKDGTTGSESSMYANLNGFYDANGDGFRLYINDSIDVTTFGATGDGSTDDYTAITAAITVTDSGGSVFFPEGVYNIGANTITMPAKLIKLYGNTYSRSGAGTRITGSGAITVDTTALASGTGPGAFSKIDGIEIYNTAASGIACRIQNGGVSVGNGACVSTGTTSIGLQITQSYGQYYDNLILEGTDISLDMNPDGSSSGQEGLNNNTFNNINIFGAGGTANWGLRIKCSGSPGRMRSNTFTGLNIEQTQNGIDMEGENNVFVGMNIESAGVSVQETSTSANTYIQPESWVSGQSKTISDQSEVIPGVTSEGVYRQFAEGQALDIRTRGIRFPATGSEITNTDPRVLDHYGEGDDTTVTMVCGTSGTITLTAAGDGVAWTRVGRMISFTGLLIVDTVSSPTGGLSIQGLPYASHTPNAFRCAVNITASGMTGSAGDVLQATIQGDANIYITRINAGVETNDVAGLITSSTNIFISGNYFVEN
ncbi:glycoside hydrolase family 55 protein [bacterium]|nr:glycoside hydrolase family 55 protein [bacterium]